MTLTIRAHVESWPIEGAFVISRGAKTEAEVVVAEISDGTRSGRGECVPYPRYGETVAGVVADIENAGISGADPAGLRAMPAGAARNALDCALWDLQAKQTGIRVADRLGFARPGPVETAYTISLGSPESMAEAAARHAGRPLLKLKLGGTGDGDRVHAVRRAAPRSRIIVDANEAWSEDTLADNLQACASVGVALIEQPLKAGHDDMLLHIEHVVPICADESVHIRADLDALAGKYDAVNIKLDKAGGLSEAHALLVEARKRDFHIMIGCMLGTSLAMAPAVILAQDADWVDLDGPLLLARDRDPALRYPGATVAPPDPELWG